MHLPQIAALPKVVEDLAEPGRAVPPASEGDGFLSVFSGGPATGVPEPSGSEPPALIRSARAAFVDFAHAPKTHASGFEARGTDVPRTDVPRVETTEIGTRGAETRGTEMRGTEVLGDEAGNTLAPAIGTILPRADRVPEPTDVMQLPTEEVGARVMDEGAQAKRQSTGGQTAALTTDTDFALLDGWMALGVPVAVTAPGGTHLGRAPEAFAQANVPVPSGPEKVEGGMPTLVGADAGEIAVPENTAVAGRALHIPAPGSEKPALSLPTSLPTVVLDVAGSAARSGAAPVDPRPTPIEADARGSAQMAGATPQADAALLGGQVRPDGISGERRAEFRPTDPTTPNATRLDGAGAVKPAGDGQTPPAALGMQIPTGSLDVPPEARGLRAEARSITDAVLPASQGAPQAEKATTHTVAAAAPAAGPGAEAAAAALGGTSGAPGAGEGLFNADPAITEIALGDARGTARGSSAATLPVLQSPETPRLVAMQIAEVVRASGERAVELRLQPEELGRVQLTMSQDATGTLTVSLNAERPETLDLLRRNIDLLSADLHELGYGSIDFSFQGDGADRQKDAPPERGDGPGALGADGATTGGTLPQSGVRGAQASGDGIDIRL